MRCYVEEQADIFEALPGFTSSSFDLDCKEIARLMRRRPGAIHSMQHRALASLYRFLLEPEQVEARRA